MITRIGTHSNRFLLFILISHALIFTIACGRGKSESTESGLTAATIPDAGCHIYTEGGMANGEGTRQFLNGLLLHSQAWDCGMREGKRCFYFIHYPDTQDSNTYHDTICQ